MPARHSLLAAAFLATTALPLTAQAIELTVYTALEADQLKAYKAAFEKDEPDITDPLGARFDRRRHRQAAGREGQPAGRRGAGAWPPPR